MKALIVIGIILLVLLLVGLIPVGAEAEYDDDGFRLKVRVGPLRLRLGGREEKQKKERADKKKKEPAEPEEEKKKKKLPSLELIKIALKRGYAFLCRLVSRFRVDVLKLHFTSAFDDPYVTAMAYAAAGTAMDGLLRVGKGHISFSDLRADVDFDRASPSVDLRVALHIRICQLVHEGLGFAFGFLIDFLRFKRGIQHVKSSDR